MVVPWAHEVPSPGLQQLLGMPLKKPQGYSDNVAIPRSWKVTLGTYDLYPSIVEKSIHMGSLCYIAMYR